MNNNNGAGSSRSEKNLERLLAINNDLLIQLIGQQAFIRGQLEIILLALPAFSLSGEPLTKYQMQLAKALIASQTRHVREVNRVIRSISKKHSK